MIGSFYFKQTKNGNLLGEFTNSLINYVSSESANRIDDLNNPFVGNYKTSWIEHEKSSEICKLVITKLSNEKFSLKWFNISSDTPIFSGEGFVIDDILIGFYTVDKI